MGCFGSFWVDELIWIFAGELLRNLWTCLYTSIRLQRLILCKSNKMSMMPLLSYFRRVSVSNLLRPWRSIIALNESYFLNKCFSTQSDPTNYTKIIISTQTTHTYTPIYTSKTIKTTLLKLIVRISRIPSSSIYLRNLGIEKNPFTIGHTTQHKASAKWNL